MSEKKEVKLSEPEQKILNVLTLSPKLRLRWGELKNKTGLSTRTLSLRLKDLETKGLIQRIVEVTADEYPPPVYYRLVGKLERQFAEMIQKEWSTLHERANELFKRTFKNPKAYFYVILEATERTIIVQFRVTPKQWKQLLRRADGKGKLSTYIRRKLGD